MLTGRAHGSRCLETDMGHRVCGANVTPTSTRKTSRNRGGVQRTTGHHSSDLQRRDPLAKCSSKAQIMQGDDAGQIQLPHHGQDFDLVMNVEVVRRPVTKPSSDIPM